jgi:hypothetical protein
MLLSQGSPFHQCTPILQGHPPAHVIISKMSYRSELEFKNYKWMLSQELLFDTSYSDVAAAIATISGAKSGYPTLNKVR